MTHLHDLCQNLRALSPGYCKMDGSYVEIGREAAEVIERLVKELEYTKIACERLREDRDEAADKIELLVKERDEALAQSDAAELRDIAAAIGSVRFMDPPDGGDVSLAEQVCRMRKALEKAEAALAEDKPLGFRTWDVPNPYAEGPQSDE